MVEKTGSAEKSDVAEEPYPIENARATVEVDAAEGLESEVETDSADKEGATRMDKKNVDTGEIPDYSKGRKVNENRKDEQGAGGTIEADRLKSDGGEIEKGAGRGGKNEAVMLGEDVDDKNAFARFCCCNAISAGNDDGSWK